MLCRYVISSFMIYWLTVMKLLYFCAYITSTPWCNGLMSCNVQMLGKLSKQLSGKDWTWNNLNTLCWAIGSISGSMGEEQVLQINKYAFSSKRLFSITSIKLFVWSTYYMRNYHIFLVHFPFIALLILLLILTRRVLHINVCPGQILHTLSESLF